MTRKYELKLNDEIIPVIVNGSNDETLIVTINETKFIVRITDADRDQGVFHVVVGDQKLTLHLTPQQDSEGYKVTLNKQHYTALLRPVSSDLPTSTSSTVATTPRTPIRAQTSIAPPDAATEPGTVVAPLPGRVIEVPVKEGDKVESGDVVIVLEAMKMANEIRATQPGVVSQVHVQTGNAVEKGQPLVTIG